LKVFEKRVVPLPLTTILCDFFGARAFDFQVLDAAAPWLTLKTWRPSIFTIHLSVNQKLRKAIEDLGGLSRIEGLWSQFSTTERTSSEPSAVSLLRVSRDRDRALVVNGRAWQEDGTLSARYWSEAAKELKNPAASSAWRGERPR
jgi:hypothetical protein